MANDYDNIMNDNIDNVDAPKFDPEANMDAQECLRIERNEVGNLSQEKAERLAALEIALRKWRISGGYPGAWHCYPLTARAFGYRFDK